MEEKKMFGGVGLVFFFYYFFKVQTLKVDKTFSEIIQADISLSLFPTPFSMCTYLTSLNKN